MEIRRNQENVSLLTKQINGKQPPWDVKDEKKYTKPSKNEHAWEKIPDLDLKEGLEQTKDKKQTEKRFVTVARSMLAMLTDCIIANCTYKVLNTKYNCIHKPCVHSNILFTKLRFTS